MAGASELQRTLRMLCLNTEWKYAVFWKLKHRARMVLTWEDAYYDMSGRNGDPTDNKCSSKNLHDGSHGHDPLGLSLAKMSYLVHSVGEGVVGQVAASGKHQWIYAENHGMTSSSFEYPDGWQNQFSVGIKTIVAVAVVPYGVVQLGSFSKVIENTDIVTRIRDVFMALPDSSIGHISHPIQSSLHSSSQFGKASKTFASEVPDYLHHLHKTLNSEESDFWLSVFPFLGRDNDSSYILSLPSNNEGMTVDIINKHGEPELHDSRAYGSAKLLQSKENIVDLAHGRIIGTRLDEKHKRGNEILSCKDSAIGSGNHVSQLHHESVTGDNNSCNVMDPFEKAGDGSVLFSSDLIDSTVCDKVRLNSLDYHQNEAFYGSDSSDIKFHKNMENMELRGMSSHMDASSTSSKFPAGYELHEALGLAFLKKSKCFDWEPLKSEVTIPENPEQVRSSHLSSESHPEHLLEAVIANVCQNPSDVKSEKSFCKSVQSILTAENYAEPSSHTTLITDSSNHSIGRRAQIGEETQHCMSASGVSGVMSPRGFSSCPSTSNEQFDRSSAPTKNNKKRARPGENCRPRPRDRQLIQDRIKELRDLIPSGAKCSIDSLLERTIKHMLYLQSITKHADKLNKYSDTKLCQKEASILEPSTCERGSSWAVEVGGNLKVCSIIVENLNKNGQMIVEMMCEECSYFLEIAEAIKSLGLTILKGVTKAHGEKTWICFVVEGQSNRILHRMDILWSLVQILQPQNDVHH